MGEHPRLARTGAGDDQQWTAPMHDGIELIGVERIQVERFRHGHSSVRRGCRTARGVDLSAGGSYRGGVTSLRRAALALVPALVLGLAACGSDGGSAAPSTPSTPATTTVAPTTSVAPGTTNVGQPIPIGQETTAAPTTAGPGTSGGSTETSAGATTVVVGSSTATTARPGSSTTAATATTAASQTSTTVGDDGDNSEPPSPNADTAFCKFESEMEQTGVDADSDDEYLQALALQIPKMDQWITDAPNNELRAAATTMREAAKQAVATKSQDPLLTDDATEALLRIRLFCGST